MTAFSDNFPFDPAQTDSSAAEAEPVVHAEPGHFNESFPFGADASAQAGAANDSDGAPMELELAAAATAVMQPEASSIFGDGFPFDAPRVFDDAPARAAVEPARASSEPATVAPASTPPAPEPISIFTDENALTANVIPPAAPDPLTFPDRRKSPRQTMLAKAMLRPDAGGPARAVELRNLSLLGVRFRSHESIRIGERFHIKLEVGPLKWATRLRVINCVKDETGAAHYIGCAFIGNELTRTYPVAA
jgi:hypothetical protein